MIKRFILFLLLNFAALAIAAKYTSTGVPSDWYVALHKAPWTPPGWMFGAAWSLIMICYAYYMAKLIPLLKNTKKVYTEYAAQWLLNVAWSPVFFYFHQMALGLLIIIALFIVVCYFLLQYRTTLKQYSLFIAPYFLWLIIAISLNGYAYLNN